MESRNRTSLHGVNHTKGLSFAMNVSAQIHQIQPRKEGEILVIVGPTASGKTALAIELAQRLGGEIVGVDSVQIYQHLDIGSGKPTKEERTQAPYHLIDFADPHTPLDAGAFASLAHQTIEQIQARGRLPILCGGTYLWVKAILEGLIQVPPSSAEIRARHRDLIETHGNTAFYQMLIHVDQVSASKINPNDVLRVSRALEIYELTGERMSDLFARHQAQPPRYCARRIGLQWPRETLAERIAKRTTQWLTDGWIEEVRKLREDGYASARPLGSVGYRQILDVLEERAAPTSLEDAINQATRVFVRRQMTWLRDEPVQWLSP